MINYHVDPDEDYLTEEEDFDLEEENDRREIAVDDDLNEPDPEDESFLNEPDLDGPEDED